MAEVSSARSHESEDGDERRGVDRDAGEAARGSQGQRRGAPAVGTAPRSAPPEVALRRRRRGVPGEGPRQPGPRPGRRVQRYFVEGMIAAGRRSLGASMFDVRFTSTIPSGSNVCHFDMFPKEATADAWDEYSDRLRQRALNIVAVRTGEESQD